MVLRRSPVPIYLYMYLSNNYNHNNLQQCGSSKRSSFPRKELPHYPSFFFSLALPSTIETMEWSHTPKPSPYSTIGKRKGLTGTKATSKVATPLVVNGYLILCKTNIKKFGKCLQAFVFPAKINHSPLGRAERPWKQYQRRGSETLLSVTPPYKVDYGWAWAGSVSDLG